MAKGSLEFQRKVSGDPERSTSEHTPRLKKTYKETLKIIISALKITERPWRPGVYFMTKEAKIKDRYVLYIFLKWF